MSRAKAQERYWLRSLEIEDSSFQQILAWLKKLFGATHAWDTRRCLAPMADVAMILPGTPERFVEVEVKVRKARYAYTCDLAVETVSNVERNRPGWLLTSLADYLAYFYLDESGRRLLPYRYVLDLPAFREWLLQRLHKYPRLLVPNPPENPIYHSAIYLVPVWDIPKRLFRFRREPGPEAWI